MLERLIATMERVQMKVAMMEAAAEPQPFIIVQPKPDKLFEVKGKVWRWHDAPEWQQKQAVTWCRAHYGAWRDLDAKRAEIAARPAYVPA